MLNHRALLLAFSGCANPPQRMVPNSWSVAAPDLYLSTPAQHDGQHEGNFLFRLAWAVNSSQSAANPARAAVS